MKRLCKSAQSAFEKLSRFLPYYWYYKQYLTLNYRSVKNRIATSLTIMLSVNNSKDLTIIYEDFNNFTQAKLTRNFRVSSEITYSTPMDIVAGRRFTANRVT